MSRPTMIQTGACALAGAGLLWCVKALAILISGNQPALTFELGQLLFPVGIVGVYATLDRRTRLAKTGAALALLSLLASSLALVYPLVPGATISTGEEFVLPFSLFVLIGSAAAFIALAIMGIAARRAGTAWGRWRSVPLITAMAPVPLSTLGAIHFELPILGIGASWIWLAYRLWRAGDSHP